MKTHNYGDWEISRFGKVKDTRQSKQQSNHCLRANMSDVNTLVIEPITRFYRDSAYLVKKCTKPDHKGKCFVPYLYRKSQCSRMILS